MVRSAALRSLPVRLVAVAALAAAGFAVTGATATASECETPDGAFPLATVKVGISDGPQSAASTATVGRPAKLLFIPRATFSDDFDPVVTWTARLRGSDRTIVKRVESGNNSDQGQTITFDAPGTWEVRASFEYPLCPPDYTGEPNPVTEKASFETAPAVVDVSEANAARVRAVLVVPVRKRGFPDDGRTPTRLQWSLPILNASFDCGSEANARNGQLSWRVYIAKGRERPSGKGNPSVLWKSRPTGCVDPPPDENVISNVDLGPDLNKVCTIRGLPCSVQFESMGVLALTSYKTTRVLVELRQGSSLLAAYRFRFRVYRNLPNPSKKADGPFTFVSVANDGRCESMPAGKCSSYKTDTYEKLAGSKPRTASRSG